MIESIKPWAPAIGTIGAAIIAIVWGLKSQLKLQYRIKLLERAHAAVDQIGSDAFEGVRAHQAWSIHRRAKQPDREEMHQEARKAYLARFALRRSGTKLPPELYRAFASLFNAYETLDRKACEIHANDEHPDQTMKLFQDFHSSLEEWETRVREWSERTWRDSVP